MLIQATFNDLCIPLTCEVCVQL